MKTNLVSKGISLFAMAFLASSLTSCFGTIDPEQPKSNATLPEGFSMYAEADKDKMIVHFTEARVSGTITMKGNTDYLPVAYEKNISVTVSYGTDKYEPTQKVTATLDEPEGSYYSITIPFTAKLTGLADGEVYYFSINAAYGKSDSEEVAPIKFFTLPKGPVDLDLKSGNLWSSTNLGADYPEDAGDYYAWAELEVKKTNALYDWSNYKWCMGAFNELTKYCSSKYYGYESFVDNKTAIDLEDDAAAKELGGKWHIPSSNEWSEIKEQCGWESTIINGVRGWLVRSKSNPDDNKKVIFLPAAGYRDRGRTLDYNNFGYYWSSNCVPDGQWYYAYNMQLGYSSYQISTGARCFGESIRPVTE